MTSPSVVVGRYRLDALVRPDVDPSTWRGTDLREGTAVRVCLVPSETGSAARSRRGAPHPGLLPVIDVVRLRDGVSPPLSAPDPRGDTFVVLEPVVGETLDQAIERKGAFDGARAVRLILGLANGLAAIHGNGSVHGAVLPLAIEIRGVDEGGPRLGLAGIHDGAMAYSSPSRLCDGGPSTHDDAWGLLASLYFAVTASAPFSAESPQALARRVLGGRPVPIRAVTPAQHDLQRMFDRGFSRTAAQRYPDMSALRDDLRAWLASHGQVSDAALVSIPPPAEEVRNAVTARKPSREGGAEAYPRVFPGTTSARHKTVPWGADPDEDATTDVEGFLSLESKRDVAAGTPPETPVARLSPPSRAAAASSRPPSGPASAPPANDETARFSREQLALLEREAERAVAAAEPVGARVDAMAATMMASSVPTERKVAVASVSPAAIAPPQAISPESAATGEVIERAAPPPPRPAPSTRSARGPIAVALVGAVAIGLGWFLTRPSAPPPGKDRPRDATVALPPRASSSQAAPLLSLPGAKSASPPASNAVVTPIAAPSSSAGGASSDEVLACAARSFPPDTFDPDAELSFLCTERNGRRGAQKLRRAIVAGGRGVRISEAMREWSRYRWYELPVYATLRARCCPGAEPVDPPAVSVSCVSPRDTLHAVAVAAARGGDLDGALRQYRRLVTCLMESGDFPAFGQTAPIGGGEEASFRAVVARDRR